MATTSRIEVGIIVRLGAGAPPVVISSVADEGLLRHALRLAIDAAARRALSSRRINRPDLLAAFRSPGRLM